jgi:hypothetical protein
LLVGRAQQVAGLVLLVFGLAVCWLAARLSLGEVSRPGPGFFPIVLGAMLALMLLLLRLAGRGWRMSALLAVASTLLSYVLFESLLGTPLPQGILEALG